MPRSMSESPAIVPIAVALIEFSADQRNPASPPYSPSERFSLSAKMKSHQLSAIGGSLSRMR